MSRRLPSGQKRYPTSYTENNHYQASTLPVSQKYHQTYNHPPRDQTYHQPRQGRRENHVNGAIPKSHHRTHPYQHATIDIGFSDTTTDTYDCYHPENGFRHSPLRESRNTDVTFSDESDSIKLPYVEFDDESNKRYSRNTFSDRGYKRPRYSPEVSVNHKDLRKVYPNHEGQWEQTYQEIQTPCDSVPAAIAAPRRIPTRASERSRSSLSSGVTSAIVHGCGGKCQTFENVCYFFLQLIFTMGILVGLSLCIAGVVLRKSPARNLQVLVYIGGLLAGVSAVLLMIQCNARRLARKRKKAIQMAKRAPIPMDNLHIRTNPFHQQPLVVGRSVSNQRITHMPQIHASRPLPSRPDSRESQSIIEEPGIPWWRRKDLNTQ